MSEITSQTLTELVKVCSRLFHCCNKKYHEMKIFEIYSTYEPGEPVVGASNALDITAMKFTHDGKRINRKIALALIEKFDKR